MSDRRARILVRGLVQGVAYRAATQRQARDLGLTGWVRNQADGSVLLEAQGPADKVTELQTWCRSGPPLADVSGISVDELAPVADERGFVIAG